MLRFIFGGFFILHGLVHLLYFGQSQQMFDLQPGMIWPSGSWVFSKSMGDKGLRALASVCLVLITLGFVAGGAGVLFGQAWWRPAVAGAAAFAALVFALFWNGRLHRLDNQGGIGLLIDLAILALVLIVRWPDFGF